MINISENGYKLTEAIRTIISFIYYWLEGIALAVIPSRFQRKSIAGEKVLITGAGWLYTNIIYFISYNTLYNIYICNYICTYYYKKALTKIFTFIVQYSIKRNITFEIYY